MKILKFITLLAFISSVISIICGFTMDVNYSEKLIGFGVFGLFFIVFPLFSYYRWKGKSINDYMLNEENLKKMRENQK